MKIIEVLTPEEANEKWNVNNGCNIVRIQVDAIDLDGSNFSPCSDNYLLKNGLKDSGRLIVGFDNLKWIGEVTFGEEGTTECYAAYEGELDEVKSFIYYRYGFSEPIYFALR